MECYRIELTSVEHIFMTFHAYIQTFIFFYYIFKLLDNFTHWNIILCIPHVSPSNLYVLPTRSSSKLQVSFFHVYGCQLSPAAIVPTCMGVGNSLKHGKSISGPALRGGLFFLLQQPSTVPISSFKGGACRRHLPSVQEFGCLGCE